MTDISFADSRGAAGWDERPFMPRFDLLCKHLTSGCVMPMIVRRTMLSGITYARTLAIIVCMMNLLGYVSADRFRGDTIPHVQGIAADAVKEDYK
jgi:hypothetical protein